jgi:hypothetical protein
MIAEIGGRTLAAGQWTQALTTAADARNLSHSARNRRYNFQLGKSPILCTTT